MPNCDYYADLDDHAAVLDGLYAEQSCAIYEVASDFEQELRRFASTAEVLAQFDRQDCTGGRRHSVHLQLYVHHSGPPFAPRKVWLDPAYCNGATYRYAAEGWGLVQLYLHRPTTRGLENSHTNHFTQSRAHAVATTSAARAEVDAWDFQAITAFSARLNRRIKRLSVGMMGSRPVLPGALQVWHSGMPSVQGKGRDYTWRIEP